MERNLEALKIHPKVMRPRFCSGGRKDVLRGRFVLGKEQS